MGNERNERRKRAKRRAAMLPDMLARWEKDQARDAEYVRRMTQDGRCHVPAKRKVKDMRKESHAMDERARYQSGYKGPHPAGAKEMRHYIPTFSLRDRFAFVREKAWLRRKD